MHIVRKYVFIHSSVHREIDLRKFTCMSVWLSDIRVSLFQKNLELQVPFQRRDSLKWHSFSIILAGEAFMVSCLEQPARHTENNNASSQIIRTSHHQKQTIKTSQRIRRAIVAHCSKCTKLFLMICYSMPRKNMVQVQDYLLYNFPKKHIIFLGRHSFSF